MKQGKRKCKKCNGQGYRITRDGERLVNRKIQIVGSSNRAIWGGKIKTVCTSCYGAGRK